MIKSLITRTTNKLKHGLRDIGKPKRSSQWRAKEKEILQYHGYCAACGSTENLQVHHKVPFHINPDLELDDDNLIVLCMSKNECHLDVGHLFSFKKYNPNVEADAEKILHHKDQKDVILKKSLEDYSNIILKQS